MGVQMTSLLQHHLRLRQVVDSVLDASWVSSVRARTSQAFVSLTVSTLAADRQRPLVFQSACFLARLSRGPATFTVLVTQARLALVFFEQSLLRLDETRGVLFCLFQELEEFYGELV